MTDWLAWLPIALAAWTALMLTLTVVLKIRNRNF